MTAMQLLLLGALALLILGMLASVGLVIAGIYRMRQEHLAQVSLLKRLENATGQMSGAQPPRKKYNVFWSQ